MRDRLRCFLSTFLANVRDGQPVPGNAGHPTSSPSPWMGESFGECLIEGEPGSRGGRLFGWLDSLA